MRDPTLRLHLDRDELLVDSFAGGGGASTGIELATGRSPDVAINHDADALSMHEANHPRTRHLREDVWDVDPVEACGGRPVGLAWFSPDCTFFSKARGAKPYRDRRKASRRRSLAHVVIRWAKAVRPRVICMENVEEFLDWCPLTNEGVPDWSRSGFSFRRWLRQLENTGYRVEWRKLTASDYGAPTSRTRLFVIARCDGAPIVWPEPTHGGGLFLRPYRQAAECIDWSIPALSIFATREEARAFAKRFDLDGVPVRPLAENTLRRIARGVKKFVLDAADPFLVPLRGTGPDHASTHAIGDPLSTISAQGTHHGLVLPFLTEHANASSQRNFRLNEPMRTICAAPSGGHFALVAPWLVNTRNGEREGQEPRVRDAREPYPTITAQGSQGAVAAAFLASHYGRGENDGSDFRDPFPTITTRDHHAVTTAQIGGLGERDHVYALLVKFYGNEFGGQSLRDPLDTITTRDRFGLVTVRGRTMTDIGMRMLQPRELYVAQSFPRSYVIDRGADGRVFTKSQQVHFCGNSVAPEMAAALVRANLGQAARVRRSA